MDDRGVIKTWNSQNPRGPLGVSSSQLMTPAHVQNRHSTTASLSNVWRHHCCCLYLKVGGLT